MGTFEQTKSAASAPALFNLPLIGRATELSMLGQALTNTAAGRGTTVILAGEGGIGKTRLAKAAAEQAERRNWQVALGRAYPVETGVPYALFSDALLPILRKLDASTLQVLTRGGSAELGYLFPALVPAHERMGSSVARGDPAEFKARLLWNFTQFLARLSAKQPLVLVLENLQWADAASLELLHFVARQISQEKLLLLCTYNATERDLNPTLRTTEQSLVALGVAQVHQLRPLTRDATEDLIHEVFHTEKGATREFSALLYGWTRGNPFFIEETLKALIESGQLYERDGAWLGWELDTLQLPRSIREAVVARVDRLSPHARTIANLAAVIGTRATYEQLGAVSALSSDELLAALDELRRQGVLSESSEGEAIAYDFTHPTLQDTLYGELGRARARLHHATVAEALESFYGPDALDHADELAFHFSRADARSLASKAVKYLAAAGRVALAKYANREAANYLSSALALIEGGEPSADPTVASGLVEDLARARQRLGEYESARALLARARADAARLGEHARLAAIERRIGLACYWTGQYEDALEHYDAGLAAARAAGNDLLYARIQIPKGACLQELGRRDEAQEQILGALAIAERLGDASVLARVHRALLVLYAWTGPSELAREHGMRALALAEASGQKSVACTAHWALAMLAGFTGNAAEAAHHIAESERLADEVRSPLLRVWTAEVAIEHASGVGDWDAALSLGERTIALARTLGQRTLLPRLLVWSALVYLARGDRDRCKRYLDEAWTLAGADGHADRPLDVHAVVPVHTGFAAYHLELRDYRRAIEVGEAGLAIADRPGYVVWAIHRLLPIIAEAAMWLKDWDRAERIGARLRHDSQRLGQRLGLAWADACDALVVMLKTKDHARAVVMLRDAAERMEAIPYVNDGARLRKMLAKVLAEMGDRDGATRELRRVHDVFARLGAERELSATRDQLRDLGARPPARAPTAGVGGLTGREVDIARLVSERKSNKEIGAALGISARTVSTHLSNIFGKLSVASRGELADRIRESGLAEK
jgi:predicted ATPase/DNA-binding CsgD family transcriptional regulator